MSGLAPGDQHAAYRRLADRWQVEGLNCGLALPAGTPRFHDMQRALVWRLLQGVTIDAHATVLDVGCGIGGPARWIWDRYRPRRLVGLDVDAGNVSVAHQGTRPAAAGPRFVQGDAHRLPMAGGSADLIVSIESALHLADKPAFLASCRRVLRPGGTLCVADMTAGRAIAVLAAAGTRLPRRLRCGAHLWNAERYEAAIAAAGLDLVRHESIRAGVAAALARGVRDIAGDWAALDGCRTRAAWAMALAALFTTRALGYDLFVARRPR